MRNGKEVISHSWWSFVLDEVSLLEINDGFQSLKTSRRPIVSIATITQDPAKIKGFTMRTLAYQHIMFSSIEHTLYPCRVIQILVVVIHSSYKMVSLQLNFSAELSES